MDRRFLGLFSFGFSKCIDLVFFYFVWGGFIGFWVCIFCCVKLEGRFFGVRKFWIIEKFQFCCCSQFSFVCFFKQVNVFMFSEDYLVVLLVFVCFYFRLFDLCGESLVVYYFFQFYLQNLILIFCFVLVKERVCECVCLCVLFMVFQWFFSEFKD